MTYIIDAIRTPIGNFGGTLKDVRTDDLGAIPIREIINRTGIDPSKINDVILGCANQAGEDNRNIARMSLLLAGLPYSVPGETVNRLCASGMSSVIHAHRAICAGDGNLFIAGGVENMTRGPWVISKVSRAFGRDAQMHDSSFGWRFINPKMKELYGTEGMGNTAENLAEKYNISREDQDLFAYNSQMKAAKSQKSGRFSEEIISVEIPQRKKDSIIFNQDEFIRPNTTTEILSKLKAVFKKEGGTVTAGNASGLNDGAAAMLLSSEKGIKENNLTPIAKIISSAVVGVEPRIMGIGPVEASNQALKKAGLSMKDMDIIELNEAFSAQAIACIREWKLNDEDPRINPNGGAIALGHPIGASGSRIVVTLIHEMIKRDVQKGLATLCVGGGMGISMCIERD